MNVTANTLTDGDKGFLGVDMRRDPDLVSTSLCSNGRNMRFSYGVGSTRRGIVKFPWANLYAASAITPFTTIYGAGLFNDPNGVEWLVLATSSGLYRISAGTEAQTLGLEAGQTITSDVWMVQCFDKMVMFRGDDLAPLVMNSIDEGFMSITDKSLTDLYGTGNEPTDPITPAGTEAIPNSTTAICFQNRLVIPYSGDQVAVSEILNYTRFHPIENNFRINQGTEDDLVGVYPFNPETLLFLKRNSIYAVTGLTGDWYATASLQELTREYGCVSFKTIKAVGRDVWFLSEERGVCSIGQSEDGKLRGLDLPVSEEMDPVIRRINWAYAAGATATWFNNRYYLAVPLDDARQTGPSLVINSEYTPQDGSFDVTVRAGSKLKITVGNATKIEDITSSGPTTNATYQDGTSGWADGVFEYTSVGDTVRITLPSSVDITCQVNEVLDGVNNAVLIYDFLNQKWSGYDELPSGTTVKDWVALDYNGKKRLFFASDDGFINLYDDEEYGTFSDMVVHPDGDVFYEDITTTFKSRGYSSGFVGRKRFNLAHINLRTWNPNMEINFWTDGVQEKKQLVAALTRDRTKFDRPWNAAAFTTTSTTYADLHLYETFGVMLMENGTVMALESDTTGPVWNSSDNACTEYREDYSLPLATGEAFKVGSNGIDFDKHQEWSEEYRVRSSGRYGQVEIINTQGRVEVVDVGVTGLPGVRDTGSQT